MFTVIHLKCKHNDTNGNARRIFMIVIPDKFPRYFVEDSSGINSIPEKWRRTPECSLIIHDTQYRALKREAKFQAERMV
jgi:hypothetical protein